MRKLDFFAQTILILTGVVTGIATLVNRENGLILLIVQFGLGVWQMVSCGVSLIIRGPMFRKKLLHFIIALLYLGTLTFMENMAKPVAIAYLIAPAWALGIYYYVLTWQRVFVVGRDRGSFLPNLSF